MPGYSEITNFRQNVFQTQITVGAASVVSAAFGQETYAIRVASTVGCFIKVGGGGGISDPVADVNSAFLPLNWIEYILVIPGQKIAIIQQAAGGVASVTELTT
jgi:hypothetical protein